MAYNFFFSNSFNLEFHHDWPAKGGYNLAASWFRPKDVVIYFLLLLPETLLWFGYLLLLSSPVAVNSQKITKNSCNLYDSTVFPFGGLRSSLPISLGLAVHEKLTAVPFKIWCTVICRKLLLLSRLSLCLVLCPVYVSLLGRCMVFAFAGVGADQGSFACMVCDFSCLLCCFRFSGRFGGG